MIEIMPDFATKEELQVLFKPVRLRVTDKVVGYVKKHCVSREIVEKFCEFWKVYPRKVNSHESFKRFLAIVRSGDASADELVMASEAYAVECKNNRTSPKFIKHPTTFLGVGECYVDYIPETQDQPVLEMPSWVNRLISSGE